MNNHPSIRVEGGLVSVEFLAAIASADFGQSPAEFGLEKTILLRDEIAQAWADASLQYRIFSKRIGREDPHDRYGTTRTRDYLAIPILGMLGWRLESVRKAEVIGERSYPISHRESERGVRVHIVSAKESLDRPREGEARRISPHALVQEFLNRAEEHLWAVVTNGRKIRVLRDASRLVRITCVEFDLERMFAEDLFADFAILYRFLHATRFATGEAVAESLVERYHQESLIEGSRIRDRLAEVVKGAIKILADGFLAHPENHELIEKLRSKTLAPDELYHCLLHLVYRLLFLFVIEERRLVQVETVELKLRRAYELYYSASAVRKRAAAARSSFYPDRHDDLWRQLCTTFSLFEDEASGAAFGILPPGGELFSSSALGPLATAKIGNKALARALRDFDSFEDRAQGRRITINYGALDVEEFGSIYEGMLEYCAEVDFSPGRKPEFGFLHGDERRATGSHYTPEELVKPLLAGSLDHLIAGALAASDNRDEQEKRLLALRLLDPACGSGHILLAAARRIAFELARTREGVEQPSPPGFRTALRDVIQNCVHGVDINPLAVELCKIALWLESHCPGTPLSFLDHKIRRGNSIVGVLDLEALSAGIPDEAFKKLDRDEAAVASRLRRENKAGRGRRSWQSFDEFVAGHKPLDDLIRARREWQALPESTPAELEVKRLKWEELEQDGQRAGYLKLADCLTAQFFLPKTETNIGRLISNETWGLCRGEPETLRPALEAAQGVARERGFFHWFLEFPAVMAGGGFDCIIANPPFLGGSRLSGVFGDAFLNYVKCEYAPAGSIDLVGYFARRMFGLARVGGFVASIATNTLAQGATREGGLAVIEAAGGVINSALRSRPWPGIAAVSVSLLTIHRGEWGGRYLLDGREVERITIYLDDSEALGEPYPLVANVGKSFMGSTVIGLGFVLSPSQAEELIARDARNREVLFPYINGNDLNSRPDQSASRWIINFQDWPLDRASAPEGYAGPVAADYPACLERVERLVKPERLKQNRACRKKYWWQFAERAPALYRAIAPLERVLVVAQVSRTLAFSFIEMGKVYDAKLIVFSFDQSLMLALLQSAFHFLWSWRFCTTMKNDLSYTPTALFQTFPFPLTNEDESAQLDTLGNKLDESRRAIMLRLEIGLTKLYNLYHARELEAALDTTCRETLEREPEARAWVIERITELRELHRQIDEAVLTAYGWHEPGPDGAAIALRHEFYELDFLPENDRERWTIHPEARREILKRLLLLNHARHADEVAAGIADDKGRAIRSARPTPGTTGKNSGRSRKKYDDQTGSLF